MNDYKKFVCSALLQLNYKLLVTKVNNYFHSE